MAQLFAVIRMRGPAWKPGLPLEAQAEWTPHANFMNELHGEGFIVIGGPLEGTPDVLLIIRARDEAEIRARFESDPWTGNGLLRIKQIAPWTLRLGALD